VNVRSLVRLEKVREPFVDTDPSPESVADVAPDEFHTTIVDPPNDTVLGLANTEHVGGCCCCTKTVLSHVAVPPGPDTRSVKVRVPVMFENVRDPFVDTDPSPESVADVASVELHESVVALPCCTVLGFATSVQVGAVCSSCTSTNTLHAADPPGPETVMV
jgi:hypothetical protein